MLSFAAAAEGCRWVLQVPDKPRTCAFGRNQTIRARHIARPHRRPRGRTAFTASTAGQAGAASPAVDAAEAPKAAPPQVELFDIVSRGDSGSQRQRIRELVGDLEATPNARPETAVFTEFALAANGGKWELKFSTSPARRDEQIRICQLIQTIDGEAKTLTNSCLWSFCGGHRDGLEAKCVLDIGCKYSFNGDSPLIQVTVDSHQLRVLPSEDGQENVELPDDLQALIQRLQKSLPMEFWDPSGEQDPATFMDPTCRIACMLSEKLQGVRSLYQRIED